MKKRDRKRRKRGRREQEEGEEEKSGLDLRSLSQGNMEFLLPSHRL